MNSKGSFTPTEGEDESDIIENGIMAISINFWHCKVTNVKDLRKAFQQVANRPRANCVCFIMNMSGMGWAGDGGVPVLRARRAGSGWRGRYVSVQWGLSMNMSGGSLYGEVQCIVIYHLGPLLCAPQTNTAQNVIFGTPLFVTKLYQCKNWKQQRKPVRMVHRRPVHTH